MKRIIYSTGILLMFFMAFCAPANNEIKIGILFDSFNAPRFQKEKIYFEKKIAEKGGTTLILSADGNEGKQKSQTRELIEQVVDALIVIASNVNTAASIARMAKANGVKIIAYDRLIRNCELDLFVSFDGIKTGEILANYAISKVPKGNFVLLNGDKSDANASELYRGSMKVLAPLVEHKKINIVYNAFVEEWSDQNAAFLTNRILEFYDEPIDVIISQYDGMSDGIIRVLGEKGQNGKVLVTGQDAEIAACKRILEDQQSMTIYKPVKRMANNCIELVYKLLKDETIDTGQKINNGRSDVPAQLFDPIAVDKNNIQNTVIADEFLTLEEIKSYKL